MSALVSNEPASDRVSHEKKPFTHRRWLLALCSLLLTIGALLLLAWVFRAPLLTGLAQAWIVDDRLEKADAVVILGGGMETRPFAAARLYRDGFAPRILLMKLRTAPTAQLGLTDPEAETARKVLIKEGVTAADILIANDEVANTYEEAIAVRNWSRTNAVKSVILATDEFHTRRAAWVFRKQLQGTGVQVRVRAVPVREYKAEDWWQHEQGVVAFQNEVIKYGYYRCKY